MSKTVKVVAGVRYDYFNLNYHDNRSGLELTGPTTSSLPGRGGLQTGRACVGVRQLHDVVPAELRRSVLSLTAITQQVKPEQFNNYEVGAKWDARDNLSINTAVYRLDRTNTRSTDPNDPTRIVQTGASRRTASRLASRATPRTPGRLRAVTLTSARL